MSNTLKKDKKKTLIMDEDGTIIHNNLKYDDNELQSNRNKEENKLYTEYRKAVAELFNYDLNYNIRIDVLIRAWSYLILVIEKRRSLLKRDISHWVVRHTLSIMLVSEWIHLPDSKTQQIKEYVERLIPKIQHLPNSLHRCEYIIKNFDYPWGDENLLKVLRGNPTIISPLDMKVLNYERSCMIVLRLQALCKEKCFDFALTWCSKTLAAFNYSQRDNLLQKSISFDQLIYIKDVYLSLLQKFRKISKLIEEVKSLDYKKSMALIKGNKIIGSVNLNLSRYRIYVLKLIANTLLKKYLTEELKDNEKLQSYCNIVKEWFNLHKDYQYKELRLCASDVFWQAISIEHINVVSDIIKEMNVPEWRELILEIYVSGIAKDLNNIEILKCETSCDEHIMMKYEIKLSHRYIFLAKILDRQKYESLVDECILTAFSLNPTAQNYELVKDIALKYPNKIQDQNHISTMVKSIAEINTTNTENTENINETGCNNAEEAQIKNKYDPVANIDTLYSVTYSRRVVQSENYNAFTAPSRIFDSIETSNLSENIKQDLSIIINSPRIKTLTWVLPWSDLDKECIKLLEGDYKLALVQKSLVTANDNLKYLKLDYSQFRHLPEPECPGIERGYEEYEIDDEDENAFYDDDIISISSRSSSCDSLFRIGSYSSKNKKKKKNKKFNKKKKSEDKKKPIEKKSSDEKKKTAEKKSSDQNTNFAEKNIAVGNENKHEKKSSDKKKGSDENKNSDEKKTSVEKKKSIQKKNSDEKNKSVDREKTVEKKNPREKKNSDVKKESENMKTTEGETKQKQKENDIPKKTKKQQNRKRSEPKINKENTNSSLSISKQLPIDCSNIKVELNTKCDETIYIHHDQPDQQMQSNQIGQENPIIKQQNQQIQQQLHQYQYNQQIHSKQTDQNLPMIIFAKDISQKPQQNVQQIYQQMQSTEKISVACVAQESPEKQQQEHQHDQKLQLNQPCEEISKIIVVSENMMQTQPECQQYDQQMQSNQIHQEIPIIVEHENQQIQEQFHQYQHDQQIQSNQTDQKIPMIIFAENISQKPQQDLQHIYQQQKNQQMHSTVKISVACVAQESPEKQQQEHQHDQKLQLNQPCEEISKIIVVSENMMQTQPECQQYDQQMQSNQIHQEIPIIVEHENQQIQEQFHQYQHDQQIQSNQTDQKIPMIIFAENISQKPQQDLQHIYQQQKNQQMHSTVKISVACVAQESPEKQQQEHQHDQKLQLNQPCEEISKIIVVSENMMQTQPECQQYDQQMQSNQIHQEIPIIVEHENQQIQEQFHQYQHDQQIHSKQTDQKIPMIIFAEPQQDLQHIYQQQNNQQMQSTVKIPVSFVAQESPLKQQQEHRQKLQLNQSCEEIFNGQQMKFVEKIPILYVAQENLQKHPKVNQPNNQKIQSNQIGNNIPINVKQDLLQKQQQGLQQKYQLTTIINTVPVSRTIMSTSQSLTNIKSKTGVAPHISSILSIPSKPTSKLITTPLSLKPKTLSNALQSSNIPVVKNAMIPDRLIFNDSQNPLKIPLIRNVPVKQMPGVYKTTVKYVELHPSYNSIKLRNSINKMNDTSTATISNNVNQQNNIQAKELLNTRVIQSSSLPPTTTSVNSFSNILIPNFQSPSTNIEQQIINNDNDLKQQLAESEKLLNDNSQNDESNFEDTIIEEEQEENEEKYDTLNTETEQKNITKIFDKNQSALTGAVNINKSDGNRIENSSGGSFYDHFIRHLNLSLSKNVEKEPVIKAMSSVISSSSDSNIGKEKISSFNNSGSNIISGNVKNEQSVFINRSYKTINQNQAIKITRINDKSTHDINDRQLIKIEDLKLDNKQTDNDYELPCKIKKIDDFSTENESLQISNMIVTSATKETQNIHKTPKNINISDTETENLTIKQNKSFKIELLTPNDNSSVSENNNLCEKSIEGTVHNSYVITNSSINTENVNNMEPSGLTHLPEGRSTGNSTSNSTTSITELSSTNVENPNYDVIQPNQHYENINSTGFLSETEIVLIPTVTNDIQNFFVDENNPLEIDFLNIKMQHENDYKLKYCKPVVCLPRCDNILKKLSKAGKYNKRLNYRSNIINRSIIKKGKKIHQKQKNKKNSMNMKKYLIGNNKNKLNFYLNNDNKIMKTVYNNDDDSLLIDEKENDEGLSMSNDGEENDSDNDLKMHKNSKSYSINKIVSITSSSIKKNGIINLRNFNINSKKINSKSLKNCNDCQKIIEISDSELSSSLSSKNNNDDDDDDDNDNDNDDNDYSSCSDYSKKLCKSENTSYYSSKTIKNANKFQIDKDIKFFKSKISKIQKEKFNSYCMRADNISSRNKNRNSSNSSNSSSSSNDSDNSCNSNNNDDLSLSLSSSSSSSSPLLLTKKMNDSVKKFRNLNCPKNFNDIFNINASSNNYNLSSSYNYDNNIYNNYKKDNFYNINDIGTSTDACAENEKLSQQQIQKRYNSDCYLDGIEIMNPCIRVKRLKLNDSKIKYNCNTSTLSSSITDDDNLMNENREINSVQNTYNAVNDNDNNYTDNASFIKLSLSSLQTLTSSPLPPPSPLKGNLSLFGSIISHEDGNISSFCNNNSSSSSSSSSSCSSSSTNSSSSSSNNCNNNSTNNVNNNTDNNDNSVFNSSQENNFERFIISSSDDDDININLNNFLFDDDEKKFMMINNNEQNNSPTILQSNYNSNFDAERIHNATNANLKNCNIKENHNQNNSINLSMTVKETLSSSSILTDNNTFVNTISNNVNNTCVRTNTCNNNDNNNHTLSAIINNDNDNHYMTSDLQQQNDNCSQQNQENFQLFKKRNLMFDIYSVIVKSDFEHQQEQQEHNIISSSLLSRLNNDTNSNSDYNSTKVDDIFCIRSALLCDNELEKNFNYNEVDEKYDANYRLNDNIEGNSYYDNDYCTNLFDYYQNYIFNMFNVNNLDDNSHLFKFWLSQFYSTSSSSLSIFKFLKLFDKLNFKMKKSKFQKNNIGKIYLKKILNRILITFFSNNRYVKCKDSTKILSNHFNIQKDKKKQLENKIDNDVGYDDDNKIEWNDSFDGKCKNIYNSNLNKIDSDYKICSIYQKLNIKNNLNNLNYSHNMTEKILYKKNFKKYLEEYIILRNFMNRNRNTCSFINNNHHIKVKNYCKIDNTEVAKTIYKNNLKKISMFTLSKLFTPSSLLSDKNLLLNVPGFNTFEHFAAPSYQCLPVVQVIHSTISLDGLNNNNNNNNNNLNLNNTNNGTNIGGVNNNVNIPSVIINDRGGRNNNDSNNNNNFNRNTIRNTFRKQIVQNNTNIIRAKAINKQQQQQQQLQHQQIQQSQQTQQKTIIQNHQNHVNMISQRINFNNSPHLASQLASVLNNNDNNKKFEQHNIIIANNYIHNNNNKPLNSNNGLQNYDNKNDTNTSTKITTSTMSVNKLKTHSNSNLNTCSSSISSSLSTSFSNPITSSSTSVFEKRQNNIKYSPQAISDESMSSVIVDKASLLTKTVATTSTSSKSSQSTLSFPSSSAQSSSLSKVIKDTNFIGLVTSPSSANVMPIQFLCKSDNGNLIHLTPISMSIAAPSTTSTVTTKQNNSSSILPAQSSSSSSVIFSTVKPKFNEKFIRLIPTSSNQEYIINDSQLSLSSLLLTTSTPISSIATTTTTTVTTTIPTQAISTNLITGSSVKSLPDFTRIYNDSKNLLLAATSTTQSITKTDTNENFKFAETSNSNKVSKIITKSPTIINYIGSDTKEKSYVSKSNLNESQILMKKQILLSSKVPLSATIPQNQQIIQNLTEKGTTIIKKELTNTESTTASSNQTATNTSKTIFQYDKMGIIQQQHLPQSKIQNQEVNIVENKIISLPLSSSTSESGITGVTQFPAPFQISLPIVHQDQFSSINKTQKRLAQQIYLSNDLVPCKKSKDNINNNSTSAIVINATINSIQKQHQQQNQTIVEEFSNTLNSMKYKTLSPLKESSKIQRNNKQTFFQNQQNQQQQQEQQEEQQLKPKQTSKDCISNNGPISHQNQNNVDTSTLEQLREFDLVLKQVKERITTTTIKDEEMFTPTAVTVNTTSENNQGNVSNQNVFISSDSKIEKFAQNESSITNHIMDQQIFPKIGLATLVQHKSPILVMANNSNINTSSSNIKQTNSIEQTSTITSTIIVSSNNSPTITYSNAMLTSSLDTVKKTLPKIKDITKNIENANIVLTSPSSLLSNHDIILHQPFTTQPAPSSSPSMLSVSSAQKLSKPQEDEQTTQRIYDILAEYAEQLRNSPDLNNKPAPRRRSNTAINNCNSNIITSSPLSSNSSSCSSSSSFSVSSPQSSSSSCSLSSPASLSVNATYTNCAKQKIYTVSSNNIQDAVEFEQATENELSNEMNLDNTKSVSTIMLSHNPNITLIENDLNKIYATKSTNNIVLDYNQKLVKTDTHGIYAIVDTSNNTGVITKLLQQSPIQQNPIAGGNSKVINVGSTGPTTILIPSRYILPMNVIKDNAKSNIIANVPEPPAFKTIAIQNVHKPTTAITTSSPILLSHTGKPHILQKQDYDVNTSNPAAIIIQAQSHLNSLTEDINKDNYEIIDISSIKNILTSSATTTTGTIVNKETSTLKPKIIVYPNTNHIKSAKGISVITRTIPGCTSIVDKNLSIIQHAKENQNHEEIEKVTLNRNNTDSINNSNQSSLQNYMLSTQDNSVSNTRTSSLSSIIDSIPIVIQNNSSSFLPTVTTFRDNSTSIDNEMISFTKDNLSDFTEMINRPHTVSTNNVGLNKLIDENRTNNENIKKLTTECEEFGIYEPSTNDLFPEADLLFDTNSTSYECPSNLENIETSVTSNNNSNNLKYDLKNREIKNILPPSSVKLFQYQSNEENQIDYGKDVKEEDTVMIESDSNQKDIVESIPLSSLGKGNYSIVIRHTSKNNETLLPVRSMTTTVPSTVLNKINRTEDIQLDGQLNQQGKFKLNKNVNRKRRLSHNEIVSKQNYIYCTLAQQIPTTDQNNQEHQQISCINNGIMNNKNVLTIQTSSPLKQTQNQQHQLSPTNKKMRTIKLSNCDDLTNNIIITAMKSSASTSTSMPTQISTSTLIQPLNNTNLIQKCVTINSGNLLNQLEHQSSSSSFKSTIQHGNQPYVSVIDNRQQDQQQQQHFINSPPVTIVKKNLPLFVTANVSTKPDSNRNDYQQQHQQSPSYKCTNVIGRLQTQSHHHHQQQNQQQKSNQHQEYNRRVVITTNKMINSNQRFLRNKLLTAPVQLRRSVRLQSKFLILSVSTSEPEIRSNKTVTLRNKPLAISTRIRGSTRTREVRSKATKNDVCAPAQLRRSVRLQSKFVVLPVSTSEPEIRSNKTVTLRSKPLTISTRIRRATRTREVRSKATKNDVCAPAQLRRSVRLQSKFLILSVSTSEPEIRSNKTVALRSKPLTISTGIRRSARQRKVRKCFCCDLS